MTDKIRNIAIIAHVDHGKTTLVDKLLEAGGAYGAHQEVTERAMDSMDLEKEKGITIKSKNTSIHWNDHTINIIDTPGHADFGGEVERVMKMVDGVFLVVDAYEGPQAQTRFVLKKALAEGLHPIVVVNKVDRDFARPAEVRDMVLELFLDLDASEEQFEAPFFYGSAKNGFFVSDLENDEQKDMLPLLQGIIDSVPAPEAKAEEPFRMLVSNIDWDNYVGRVALGKVLSGQVQKGDNIWLHRKDGTKVRSKITRVFEYGASASDESALAAAGNIVGISGFEDIDIGETLSLEEGAETLPFVNIDPPTITMQFSINNGPFAGRDGKHVTSRAIRERLEREIKTNISIEVSDAEQAGVFNVSARGAMQIAVLVETMRREGFELLVSRPSVITKRIDDKLMEPFETLYVECPDDALGGVMKTLANRKARVENMGTNAHGATLEATVSTRGIIGFEFELLNLTSGHGIMSHLFKEYAPHCGEISTRSTGTLISMATGTAMQYSLLPLEDRGKLFIEPGDEVYEGQIIGENPRKVDLAVNPVKEKALTNHRSAGKDNTTTLAPPIKMGLERSIEYINADELVEATPNFLRIRKRVLDPNERKRMERKSKG
ncbi:translational GTPase TypA [Rubritalea marina]|uniref:translational GTPase TypA n=1 Tax=Rubritalea marina TaxID=361055 RepID=UPI000364AD37|nr:translational GTPase TypA [Rubritalea marina]